MQYSKSLSVVIPTFNEEEYIPLTIKSLDRVLPQITKDFEIVVVDDKSTDKTLSILKKLQKTRSYLTVVQKKQKNGLGGTLRTGFSKAKKDLVFYVDADMPFDFRDIGKAVQVMEDRNADMVIGFRYDRMSEGLIRIVYSFTYNLIIRLLFGVKVQDINFSCKLIKRSVFEKIKLRSKGSFIDAELIIKAARAHMRIYQIGTNYYPRELGESTAADFDTILGILKEMGAFYTKTTFPTAYTFLTRNYRKALSALRLPVRPSYS